MTGEADLSGQRVLVVEDDYYLATDTARALRSAGATVVGPCANEQTAEDAIRDTPPTGAVLDINLGRGPTFKLAKTLRERSIRFVFLTGYDDDVIPGEFEGVARLQKPAELRQIVNTLAKTLHGGADQHC
jgi:ActR/RegA family two-component response regulator